MEKLFLVATIAGQPVAIRASAIESVVDIGAITPIPGAPPHVAGLAALRSRVLTIVCSRSALGLSTPKRRGARGVVIAVDGHHYGVLVDGIDDACVIEASAEPIRTRLAPGWARVADAMLPFGEDLLLLIDPVRLIAGPGDAIAA